MHDILQRQLKRGGLSQAALPADKATWEAFLQDVDRAYEQADQARYLLERSLDVSSREMKDINDRLTAESAQLQKRNQQFSRVYEFARSTLEQMNATLLQGADKIELMVYVTDMKRELELITKND